MTLLLHLAPGAGEDSASASVRRRCEECHDSVQRAAAAAAEYRNCAH